MNTNLLPMDHMHSLLADITPSGRWDGTSDFKEWQKAGKQRLYDLLGIAEIEPYACKPETVIEYDRIDDVIGCREIRFHFYSEENVLVPCHLLIPLNADKPLPVVICLQGHAKGMHISLARAKYPGDESTYRDGDRDFARRAVKEGICAVALEQRCFGECGGTEKGPECRQASMRALLLGRTIIGERVWDISRCIDVLEGSFRDVVDTDKILCLGNSGGGTATTYAAALEERIRIAVPSCAVCSYADSIGAMFHCECNFIPGIAKVFDMGDICGLTAPRAMVVVSGKDDDGFPIRGALACVAQAKVCYEGAGVPEKLVHVIGGAGHRFYADDSWGFIHEAINAL